MMEHLKREIYRLTDLLQAALLYGELGDEVKCRQSLTEAVTMMTALLDHLSKHGIRLLSQITEINDRPQTKPDSDEES